MFVITLKKEYKRDYRRVMSILFFFYAVVLLYVLKFECIRPLNLVTNKELLERARRQAERGSGRRCFIGHILRKHPDNDCVNTWAQREGMVAHSRERQKQGGSPGVRTAAQDRLQCVQALIGAIGLDDDDCCYYTLLVLECL